MSSVMFNLRLTAAEMAVIDELAALERAGSRSALVVQAIHEFFTSRRINEFNWLAIREQRLSLRRRRRFTLPKEPTDAKKTQTTTSPRLDLRGDSRRPRQDGRSDRNSRKPAGRPHTDTTPAGKRSRKTRKATARKR
jgi:hypothetical protein